MKRTYEVVILGQKFLLKTENNEEHVQRIAEHVNEIMHQIRENSQAISTQNIAILGALNIAEEMFAGKDHAKACVAKWRDRLKEIIA